MTAQPFYYIILHVGIKSQKHKVTNWMGVHYMETTVRLKKVDIYNFKNVEYGHLDFESPKGTYFANILGLYGQNGSGKTALIEAISLLKSALTGHSISSVASNYINVDSAFAKLKFEFQICSKEQDAITTAIYEFCIRREMQNTESNFERTSISPEINIQNEKYQVVLFDEMLSFPCKKSSENKRMNVVIDTRTDEVFVPRTEYDLLVGKEKEREVELLVAKKLTGVSSRSFIFSQELLTIIRKNCQDAERISVINRLVSYGNLELFVIGTSNSGLISLNSLPLKFKYTEGQTRALGTLPISLNHPATIPQETVELVKKVMQNMNVVLSQIIPGLTISVKELGTHLTKDGKISSRIQLISNRYGKEISLQYESEGIKKIVSVLQLLIVVFNDSSITVAIDELDAGIFEYLLGELLRIISEKGKGQLIFTSHNLRPLEVLNRKFVAFTTTNPLNRYIRLTNVKQNNNLRDFYYRDIVLGEQSENVYESTNNYEIALAFKEAGELIGS